MKSEFDMNLSDYKIFRLARAHIFMEIQVSFSDTVGL